MYAANFYTGCSNDCGYCYLKRGVLSHVWSVNPKLKKCFHDGQDAYKKFVNDVDGNLDELRKYGIFFTFTSDPFLEQTRDLNILSGMYAAIKGINVTYLTKRSEVCDFIIPYGKFRKMFNIGFTLTGHDELEPNASSNGERIEAIKKLHDNGFMTWASLEPVIDAESSLSMMQKTLSFCDTYKVGLRSGVRKDYYEKQDIARMVSSMNEMCRNNGKSIYFKDSISKIIG